MLTQDRKDIMPQLPTTHTAFSGRTLLFEELTPEQRSVAERIGRLEELHWDEDLGWSIVTLRRGSARLRTHLGFDPIPRLDTALAALDRLVALRREPAVIWADGSHHRVQVAFGQQSNKEFPTFMAKAGE